MTELGVSHIVLVTTQNSEAVYDDDEALTSLQAVCIESAEQSERLTVPLLTANVGLLQIHPVHYSPPYPLPPIPYSLPPTYPLSLLRYSPPTHPVNLSLNLSSLKKTHSVSLPPTHFLSLSNYPPPTHVPISNLYFHRLD